MLSKYLWILKTEYATLRDRGPTQLLEDSRRKGSAVGSDWGTSCPADSVV